MSALPPSLEARPNGTFTAFFGDASSCIRYLLDKQDWAEGLKTADKAKWAMSAQSGTVIDGPGFPGYTFKNGCYRGWYDGDIARISKRPG